MSPWTAPLDYGEGCYAGPELLALLLLGGLLLLSYVLALYALACEIRQAYRSPPPVDDRRGEGAEGSAYDVLHD